MTNWLGHFARFREVACPPAAALADNAPLRVFQLTNMYPSPERPNWGVFIRSQVESLASHGVHSEVLEIEGWKSKSNYLRALMALPARVAQGRYDLIHIHYGLNALASLGVKGLPIVVSFCGDDFWGKPDSSGTRSKGSLLLADLSKRASRRADALIVKSAEMAQAIGPGFDEVAVIANGVDFEVFVPMPRDEARRQLGWPLDQDILLFPANPQEPRKNFPLAQAVEQALHRCGRRAVRLEWMYGRPQEEVVLAMNAADVMLNCSFQEGSPNAVKEAMAVNLPIVSTTVGDCAERLHDVTPGAVVARDVDAFTRAVLAVLDGPVRRSNGRQQAEAVDLDDVAGRVVDVYRRAIARHRARRQG